ncbi:o-spanin [Escherichia phage CarlSpitteler]|uniref:O-spanin n=2 Tax=Berlinvirus TaxID=2732677 RepID=A0AAE8AX75_9CAUD|nr:o-spanin [Escherichia phage CarlSpitteler]
MTRLTLNGNWRCTMSTLRKLRRLRINRLLSMKSHDNTKKTLRRWKAALIGSLMICVTMVSGCVSNYQPPHENSKLTVDASLMVEPNLTKSLVSVLSE